VSDDGTSFVRTEPIVSRDMFDRVGAEVSSRESRNEPTKRAASLQLGFIHCEVCGQPVYTRRREEPNISPGTVARAHSTRTKCQSFATSCVGGGRG
jgi:hypothetical protein